MLVVGQQQEAMFDWLARRNRMFALVVFALVAWQANLPGVDVGEWQEIGRLTYWKRARFSTRLQRVSDHTYVHILAVSVLWLFYCFVITVLFRVHVACLLYSLRLSPPTLSSPFSPSSSLPCLPCVFCRPLSLPLLPILPIPPSLSLPNLPLSYVCMHVYRYEMYVCMYVCLYVCMCACMYVW